MDGLLGTFGRTVALILLLASSGAAAISETAIPAAPNTWVTDSARLLTAQTVASQNARLRDYERTTGHQILVYIARSTGGVPIEDWSVRAFKQWKIGRKNLDDGLALFIFSQDHTLRIEVGYGLESTVPDALASRIIRDTITPALRAGKPDQGVTAGVDQILQLTGNETAANAQTAAEQSGSISSAPLGPVQIVLIVLALLGFVILAIRSPWLAVFLLVNIFSGRGGGMSGEGGFSGGGGRSGGGGASGRW